MTVCRLYPRVPHPRIQLTVDRIRSWLNRWMQNPHIRRADSTTPFHIKDLSILGFWYLAGVLEPIPPDDTKGRPY